MGQCIKCGRETANNYVYYSADYHSQDNSYQMGSMICTNVKYTNINKHTEFLCSKCARRYRGDIECYVAAGIIYLFATFFIICPFILPDKGTPPIWLIISFFGFASLFLIIGFIFKHIYDKNEKEDKRVKEDEGSNFLINIVKWKNQEKTYFTPSQYNNLR